MTKTLRIASSAKPHSDFHTQPAPTNRSCRLIIHQTLALSARTTCLSPQDHDTPPIWLSYSSRNLQRATTDRSHRSTADPS